MTYFSFEAPSLITSARGPKRKTVRAAIQNLPARFSVGDLRRACPGRANRPCNARLRISARKGGTAVFTAGRILGGSA
jgi:hypothetical protein